MSNTTFALTEPILRETASHRARCSRRTLASVSFLTGFAVLLLANLCGRGQYQAVLEPLGTMMLALRAWRGHMDLHEKRITGIQPGVFTDLTLNGTLNLHENKISNISGAFEGLRLFGDLDLHENKIKIIQPEAFKDFSLQGSLDLHENHIAEIEPGAFAGLSVQGSLDLSANKITEIQSGTFQGLSLNGSLDLSSNKLTEVLPGAFSGLSCDCVALTGNKLKEIGAAAFEGISVKRLKVIVDTSVNATSLVNATELVARKKPRWFPWRGAQGAQLEAIQVVREGSC